MENPEADARRRIQGKKNVAMGAAAEFLVKRALERLGFGQLCRIETGWRVMRVKGRMIVRGPMAKVAGDWRAVGKNGQSVLVEVKHRAEKLIYSDLESHQVRALDEHHALGGLSLLAWVHDQGAIIMRWPIPLLVPRSSLSVQDAQTNTYQGSS